MSYSVFFRIRFVRAGLSCNSAHVIVPMPVQPDVLQHIAFSAVAANHVPLAERLIKTKLIKQEPRQTMLQIAAEKGYLQIAKLLIKAGSTPTPKDISAVLTQAVIDNDQAFCRYLLALLTTKVSNINYKAMLLKAPLKAADYSNKGLNKKHDTFHSN